MRPRTHFDRVWLGDIKALFAEEIAAGRVYDPETLAVVLEHGIGLTNPLIADRLYRMFDVNQDGNLTAAEVAGAPPSCPEKAAAADGDHRRHGSLPTGAMVACPRKVRC